MILIVGGFAAGKYTYVVNELGYDDLQIARSEINDKPVLINLQNLVKSGTYDIDDSLIEKLCTKKVITCTEVGSGVVPLDREERDYREAVGRLCIELAKRADKVIRIYCGIPALIKDNK